MTQIERALGGLVSQGIDTPAAIVVLETMQFNIDTMQAYADSAGLDLRPHVKTHKCLEIGRLQVQAGAAGITAGTVSEAQVFAEAGFDDIFIAYPIWATGSKPERIRSMAATARLRIGADNVRAIDLLADAMGDSPELLEVVIEVECGARRSGAAPEAAGNLAAHARTRGLRAGGVYTYPGHGSTAPGAPEQAAADQVSALTTAVHSIQSAGLTAEFVSGGTTPTARLSTRGPMTEVRPGEYVFCDLGNLRLGVCSPDQIALFVAGTVVSDEVPDQLILDAVTKALSREGDPTKGFGRIILDGRSPLDSPAMVYLNEYHGFLAQPAGRPRLPLGTVVPVIPNHCCPVVNNFDELLITTADGAEHWTWPVQARGHMI